MKQNEFLEILGKNLQGFSMDEKKEILYDYEEHFILGRENGKTDDEIIEELGNPLDIARHYKSNRVTLINENQNNNYDKSNNKQKTTNNDDRSQYSYTPNKAPKWLLLLLLIPFIILPSLGVILGLYGTLLGLFAAAVAIVIAGFALSLAGILGTTILGFEIISLPNISMIPMPAMLFAGIGTMALGALFFIGILYLMKFLNLGTSKFFSCISSLTKR
ncbi:DUF1700 domain-containing protein [Clostridium amazonitimonense]|uniref:DUF1700 domain-containing protein n=1 Tax=Clostridium amazonitimonense TaxID=1499689 RepID=UPI000509E6E4|nr:DUF1700 domain-containing protein [Clostridium amazonitimonense]